MTRPLKFRAWDEGLKYYFYDVAIYPNNIVAIQRHNIESMMLNAQYGAAHWAELGESAIIEQYTGLKDKNGKEIYEGDILKFDDDNGIWQAPVVFERGLFGLDVHHPKQIKNPDGWDRKYDKVDSRWWSVVWGYEETGTAFTYRTPLAKATVFKGSPEEYEKSEQKKLYEKFGYGNYYVMAEVVGNVHENAELLGGEE